MDRFRLFVSAALVAAGAVTAVSCSFDARGAACESDADCRGSRICVEGACRFATSGRDGGADGTEREDTRTNDIDAEEPDPDIIDPTAPPPDIGRPPPEDTSSSDVPPVPIDTGTPPDTWRPPDVREDAPQTRQLSCHEFATCQFIVCDTYDYSCKQRYASRTSERQLGQLDTRQQCVRNHCSGKQGQERLECTAQHCEAEWDRCANRPGTKADFTCSEFHSCLHLCNGKDNRNSCVADCTMRATQTAQQRFGDYARCVELNCSDTEGRERLDCARANCRPELSRCWGC